MVFPILMAAHAVQPSAPATYTSTFVRPDTSGVTNTPALPSRMRSMWEAGTSMKRMGR